MSHRRRVYDPSTSRAEHPKPRGSGVRQPYGLPVLEHVPLSALAVPVDGRDPDAVHRARMRNSAAFLRLVEEPADERVPPEPGSWEWATLAQQRFIRSGILEPPSYQPESPGTTIDGLVRDGVDELADRRAAARARPSPPEERPPAVAEALAALADVYAAIESEEP